MKLSQLRPCDVCGGKIAPSFYVVRTSIALFKPQATQQTLGLAQYFGGNLGLAEIFSPDEDAVVVAMDNEEHKELMSEFFICQNCYLTKPIDLALLAERKVQNAPLDTD